MMAFAAFEGIRDYPIFGVLRSAGYRAIGARLQRSRRENRGHQDSDAIRAPNSGL